MATAINAEDDPRTVATRDRPPALPPLLQTFDEQTVWEPQFSGVKSRVCVVMDMKNRRTLP